MVLSVSSYEFSLLTIDRLSVLMGISLLPFTYRSSPFMRTYELSINSQLTCSECIIMRPHGNELKPCKTCDVYFPLSTTPMIISSLHLISAVYTSLENIFLYLHKWDWIHSSLQEYLGCLFRIRTWQKQRCDVIKGRRSLVWHDFCVNQKLKMEEKKLSIYQKSFLNEELDSEAEA